MGSKIRTMRKRQDIEEQNQDSEDQNQDNEYWNQNNGDQIITKMRYLRKQVG